MPENTQKGRAIVIAVIAFSIGVSAMSVVLQSRTYGASIAYFVRFALTVLLSIYLYRGSSVAKWLYVVLAGIGGIGALVVGVFVPMEAVAGLALIVMGLGYLPCVAVLIWNKPVRAYLAQQASGV